MSRLPSKLADAPLTIMAAKFWPVRHGGVESHLWHMASTLARMNVPVRVLTENKEQLAPQQTIIPCLQVHRFDPMNFGRLWRWPHAVQVRWWMDVLEQDRPTGIIWATQPCMAAAAILTGRKSQLVFNPACCVAAMRDIGKQYSHMNTMQQPRLSQWIEKFAVRHSPHIVVSSKNLASQLQRHHGRAARNIFEKLDVIKLATEPPVPVKPQLVATIKAQARKQWNIPRGATVVGFVGRLDPCKDIDFLLAAAACSRTHEKGEDSLRLLIVGDGPDRTRLEALVQKHQMTRQVIWTGNLKQPSEAYAAMDMLALTSAYEAYGLVMLEAMACGVPVLGRRTNETSVLTACDEIITHGVDGLLISASQPGSLARSIDALASLPVLKQTLVAGAMRTAQTFTWENYARRCIALLGLRSSEVSDPSKPTGRKAA